MIHRDKHDGAKPGYTVISNLPINDKALSLEAIGMLLRILSLPDNWGFNVNGLVKRFGLKKSTVTRVIKELETNDYIVRYKKKNEINQFNGWQWEIYEIPDKENIPKSAASDFGNNRHQENPMSEIPDYRETRVSGKTIMEDSEIGKSTNITKTDNNSVHNKQNTDHDQLTSEINTYKEKSMEKHTNMGDKHCYGEYKHVRLSDKDVQNLFQSLGVDTTNEFIQILDDYLEGHPQKSYGNHYRTILSWVKSNSRGSAQDDSTNLASGNVFSELMRKEGLT